MDNVNDRASFVRQWLYHLKRAAIVKGYGVYGAKHPPMPNPIIDSHVPALLVLQTMELFHEALKVYLAENPPAGGYKRTLGGRARVAAAEGSFRTGEEVLRLVDARNEVAHENKLATWEQVGVVLQVVHEELRHLGFEVGDQPNYSVAATLQRIDCPHCAIHQKGVVKLMKGDAEIEVVSGWEVKVGATVDH
ncbi:MAG: hypothetical protein IT348_10310 [Candidatus Eisenbacteria bacterium]|nr:hypothetical protein [Candidatus Eisenbacteria bacterium]